MTPQAQTSERERLYRRILFAASFESIPDDLANRIVTSVRELQELDRARNQEMQQ